MGWSGKNEVYISLIFRFSYLMRLFPGASHMKVAGMLAEILDSLRDQSGRGPTFFDL